MATYSSFLPGESHGQRSLMGYSQSMGSQSWTQLSDLHTLDIDYPPSLREL